MFFICLIPIPIGAAVKWVCMTAIPWGANAAVRSLRFVNLRNGVIVGAAGFGAAHLAGRGDEYIAFVIDIVHEIMKVIGDFLFNEETGFFWYIFDFIMWLCNWGFDLLIDFFGPGGLTGVFDWFEPGVLRTVIVLAMRLDKFFPVSESLALLCCFLGFIVAVLLIRWCLKIIPGLGG